MHWLVGLIIAAMVGFAMISAKREIGLYRSYQRGELQYLVSRKRRNRRLTISLLLLVESAFLFLGFFLLEFTTPHTSLLFWALPMIGIILLVLLSVHDFRETSRDIDRILEEASRSILQQVNKHERIN